MNLLMIILEDSVIQKNRCFYVNLAEKDLVDLAFNGLGSHIKEKLEGNDFFAVHQVHQRALAAEN